MDNNDLIRREDALNAARLGTSTIKEIIHSNKSIVQKTGDCIADFIKEIPAIEKEEPEPEEIRIDWEPVKAALENILQRTVELVGLNPTRTDETWLWTNTMAGVLLEVIRKLEEEK